MIRIEMVLQVATAMEQLPAAQREAIRLRYIEGLPVSEIASRLDRSITAVAGLLKRGLEALREKFGNT
jgi:RNA polymerase sigma-70 factor (ECF subfamily)